VKLIRECRMGPPKTWKTGAIVGSYPKPMLVFMFDRQGLSILPKKGYVPQNGELPMDSCYEDVVFEKPGSMTAVLAKTEQPRITCFDYTSVMPLEITTDYNPTKSLVAMDKFQQAGTGDYNVLAAFVNSGKPFPWKTLLFDSMTGYQDIVLNHMSSFNPLMMSDARVWAAQTGGKVRQLIASATGLPAHVIFLFHTIPPEADDQTKQLQELPNVYSKLNAVIGGLFSQYFFATKNGPKPVIKHMDFMFVKGLGARFPHNLPPECGPTFQDIYGREGLV